MEHPLRAAQLFNYFITALNNDNQISEKNIRISKGSSTLKISRGLYRTRDE